MQPVFRCHCQTVCVVLNNLTSEFLLCCKRFNSCDHLNFQSLDYLKTLELPSSTYFRLKSVQKVENLCKLPKAPSTSNRLAVPAPPFLTLLSWFHLQSHK